MVSVDLRPNGFETRVTRQLGFTPPSVKRSSLLVRQEEMMTMSAAQLLHGFMRISQHNVQIALLLDMLCSQHCERHFYNNFPWKQQAAADDHIFSLYAGLPSARPSACSVALRGQPLCHCAGPRMLPPTRAPSMASANPEAHQSHRA